MGSTSGRDFYDFIIMDEVHHGPAASYRRIFDEFSPKILLGLTATPERMDGASVAADFGDRFAAEIRLPKRSRRNFFAPSIILALQIPFLSSVTDFGRGESMISVSWRTFTRALTLRRRSGSKLSSLRCVVMSLIRTCSRIGFCVSVKHAEYMAEKLNARGITSETLLGETDTEQRSELMARFRGGELRFLFTRDVFSEGVDVPEVNTVLFLRPTESLTVFLQQLGRGLRHAPEKDALQFWISSDRRTVCIGLIAN